RQLCAAGGRRNGRRATHHRPHCALPVQRPGASGRAARTGETGIEQGRHSTDTLVDADAIGSFTQPVDVARLVMTPFDWQRVLLDDFPLLFLAEVALRASFAFATVFLFL